MNVHTKDDIQRISDALWEASQEAGDIEACMALASDSGAAAMLADLMGWEGVNGATLLARAQEMADTWADYIEPKEN